MRHVAKSLQWVVLISGLLMIMWPRMAEDFRRFLNEKNKGTPDGDEKG